MILSKNRIFSNKNRIFWPMILTKNRIFLNKNRIFWPTILKKNRFSFQHRFRPKIEFFVTNNFDQKSIFWPISLTKKFFNKNWYQKSNFLTKIVTKNRFVWQKLFNKTLFNKKLFNKNFLIFLPRRSLKITS